MGKIDQDKNKGANQATILGDDFLSFFLLLLGAAVLIGVLMWIGIAYLIAGIKGVKIHEDRFIFSKEFRRKNPGDGNAFE